MSIIFWSILGIALIIYVIIMCKTVDKQAEKYWNDVEHLLEKLRMQKKHKEDNLSNLKKDYQKIIKDENKIINDFNKISSSFLIISNSFEKTQNNKMK